MATARLEDMCAPGSIINSYVAAAYAGGIDTITGSSNYQYDSQFGVQIPDGKELVGENNTGFILKRVDHAADGGTALLKNAGFWLGNNSYIGNLLIDGNAAGNAGVLDVNAFGVVGYKVQAPMVERLFVTNNRGIGVGMSNVAKAHHRAVSVSGCVGSAPGFWCGSDSSTSFFAQGKHIYEFCDGLNNQLDGIIIGVPAIVLGGEWNGNGFGGSYNGALGAAGIFTNDAVVTADVTIMHATCIGNSEWGINTNLKNGKILHNHCELNALSGIYIGKFSDGVQAHGNICISNGTYTGTGYQNLGIKGGISFANGSKNVNISQSNRCFNDPAKGNTQKYGIEYAATAWDGLSSSNVRVASNQTSGNLTANDNLRPGAYGYGNLTGLDYDDLPRSVKLIGATAAAIPSCDGVDVIQIVGAPVITNMLGGFDGKEIEFVAVTVGVHPVIAQGSFQLQGNANFTFNGSYFSSIKFQYLNGAWREKSRCQM